MTDALLFGAGVLVVAVVFLDLASTTISLSSVRGPLSSRLAAAAWAVAARTARTPFSWVRRAAGPLLILVTLAVWVLALTLGWTLVFSVDGALESTAAASQQASPVRAVDAFFFVFGSLIGRGSSTLAPDAAWWSSIEALMSLSGVALITLSLAWILPIVSAVVQKRSVAARVSALGGTPDEIIRRAWNGRDFGDLNLHLNPFIAELTLLAQRHLAYPLIHYFHSADERTAVGPRIAALDEALTILEAAELHDPGAELGVGPSNTRPLRQAVGDYLSTLEHVFIHKADVAPPPPSIDRLHGTGLVDDEGFLRRLRARCDELEGRRALLLGYLRHDGWEWSDLTSSESHPPTPGDQS